MTVSRVASVEFIFHHARQLNAAEREAYLADICGDDVALRKRVEILLRADKEAGDFLSADPDDDGREETGPGAGEVGTPADWTSTGQGERGGRRANFAERPGLQIGRYTLLEQIGEGGFGTVWRAVQHKPVERHVALKIVKLGMDTRQVIARFEAERQALAMMDHPNVARVYDAGETATGRPYFVMELVKGIPIVEFADARRLDTRARLELFCQVCGAIQHAHMKGIIHRDIKPSNVMVALHDDEPLVKVIDFGIAKATNARLTEKTYFTHHRQMIGTPTYMSPEQAAMTGTDVDTRSDIYSLGVLLYELLTGSTPFTERELANAGFAEMMHIILEQMPHRPSTRLVTLGDSGTQAAKARQADPRTLVTILKGDLDWIVMKCLEKDRGRRYESAASLGADIRRHLNGEPVTAAPPSTAYTLRKFARRNRGKLAVAAAIVATITLGLVGTSVGMIRALNEKSRADEARTLELAARQDAEAKERRAVAEARRADRSAYHALVSGAAGAIRDGDGGMARRLLDNAPEALRGWEWRWLDGRLSSIRRRISTGLSIPTMALTPDDRHVVVASPDGFVRSFDATTGEQLREFASDLATPAIVFARDASLVVLSEEQPRQLVRVYDWTSGDFLWEADGVVSRHPFVPGNQRIAVMIPEAGLIIEHESRTGSELGRFCVEGRTIAAAQFSADGRELIYVDEGKQLVGIVDRDTGSVRTWHPKVWSDEWVLDAPRRRWIVADHPNHRILTTDFDTGAEIGSIAAGSVDLNERSISPSGRRLIGSTPGAVGGEPSALEVFDLAEMRRIDTIPGYPGSLRNVCFMADERYLWSAGLGGDFVILDAPADGRPHTISLPRGLIRLSSQVAPNRHDVAWGGWGNVQNWDIRTGRLNWITHLGTHYITGVAWSPDGSIVAAAESRGRVRLLSASDGSILREHEGFEKGNTCIAWMPDGRSLLLAGGCGTLAWIDAETGRRIHDMHVHDGPIATMALSNDGRRVITVTGPVVGAADNTRWIESPTTTPAVALVDALEKKVVSHTEQPSAGISAATFSRDGSMFAYADTRGRIMIHREGAAEPLVASAFNVRVRCLAFNAAGDRLVAGGVGEVTFIDTADGETLFSLRAEPDVFLDLAFLDDGNGDEALHVFTTYHAQAFSLAEPPAAIVRERGLQRRVRAIADKLFDALTVSDDVLAHIEGRSDLSDELRQALVEHARARGDSTARLNSDMLVIARLRDRPETAYRKALRMLDFLEKRLPDRRRGYIAIRALLHHRLGDHSTASSLLESLMENGEPTPDFTLTMLSIATIIEHRGGNLDKALALRRTAEAKVALQGVPGDDTTRALYAEAGMVLKLSGK